MWSKITNVTHVTYIYFILLPIFFFSSFLFFLSDWRSFMNSHAVDISMSNIFCFSTIYLLHPLASGDTSVTNWATSMSSFFFSSLSSRLSSTMVTHNWYLEEESEGKKVSSPPIVRKSVICIDTHIVHIVIRRVITLGEPDSVDAERKDVWHIQLQDPVNASGWRERKKESKMSHHWIRIHWVHLKRHFTYSGFTRGKMKRQRGEKKKGKERISFPLRFIVTAKRMTFFLAPSFFALVHLICFTR